MAYLQFDLDAKRECQFIARATGIPVQEIGWGLLELWEYCWRQKRAEVGALMLTGFFGPSAATLIPHLAEHGFLTDGGAGTFTVRGAAKRLGVHAKQVEAGRAKASNLKQNRPGLPGGEPEGEREGEPESTSGSRPALTPNTQHPTPRSLEASPREEARGPDAGEAQGDSTGKQKRRKSEPDPRHTPMRRRLEASFEQLRGGELAWSAAEASALTALLALGDDDEIDRRWRAALETSGFHGCSSLAQLRAAERWNHHAGAGPRARGDPRKGYAPVGDWSEAALAKDPLFGPKAGGM